MVKRISAVAQVRRPTYCAGAATALCNLKAGRSFE